MEKRSSLPIMLSCCLLTTFLNVSVADTASDLQTLLGQLIELEQRLAKRTVNDSNNLLAPGSHYQIQTGDTLTTIVERAYSGTGVNLSLISTMIVDHNRHAFFRDNPNFIYAGQVISIPSVDDLRALIFKGNPVTIFDKQSKAHWIRYP